MDWLFPVALLAFLIFANALYVAAEFSVVASRKTRLATMAEGGDKPAGWVLSVLSDHYKLDRLVAAAQLGITLSSLVLGFYGQSRLAVAFVPVVEAWGLSPAAAPGLAATVVLLFLTTLQVILGELFPKSLALQYPELLARITALPMRWSTALFRPLIALFNGSATMLLRALGFSSADAHSHVHSSDEIRMLAGESKSGGLLDEVEYALLDNALRIRRYTAHQTMVPRTRLLAASVDTPTDELLKLLADSPHSRLPLYEGSLDNIVGIVHLKDLLAQVSQTSKRSARDIMRPAPAIPESLTVKRLFAQLQKDHFHVAVVLDEYGGTAGIVTIEDLIERIFGEFEDEFDRPKPPLMMLENGRLRVRGDVLLDDLNEWLDLTLASEENDTLAGLISEEIGRVPAPGDEVQVKDSLFRVEEVARNVVAAASVEVESSTVDRLKERGFL